jgi:hypothetical protein
VKLTTHLGLMPKLRMSGAIPIIISIIIIITQLQQCVGFGLLHHIIPGFSIFTELDPISHFTFLKSYTTTSLQLFFGSYSWGFLISFISSILLRCPHHFIFCAFVYITIFSPFINFCNSLLLLMLRPFLH